MKTVLISCMCIPVTSWLNFVIATAKRSILMMDLSEDWREPWERAEDEELVCEEALAEAELEFFCPDEEPTAVHEEPDEVTEEPCAKVVSLPLARERDVQLATPARAAQQPETDHGPSASAKRAREDAGEADASATSVGSFSPGSGKRTSDTGLSGQGKRVRYRVKTAAPKVAPTPEDGALSANEDFVKKGVWSGMTFRAQYNYLYEKIRCFYIWQVHGTTKAGNELDAWNAKVCREKQAEARQAYKELDAEGRSAIARKWMVMVKLPPYMQGVLEEKFPVTDVGSKVCQVKTPGVLLTWNLPGTESSDTVKIEQCLPPGQLTVEELVTRLRELPIAQALWGKVQEHGDVCKQVSGAHDVAVCMEVCPETYELQTRLRLHVHMFLKTNADALRLKHLDFFSFTGSPAHVSTQIGGMPVARGRRCWCGFFYCCLLEKRGTVFTNATKAPFTKFLVNPAWIMSLVQSGKLSASVARELLVKCVNASRHVKELEEHEREMEKKAVQVAMLEANRLLSNTLKEQKSFHEAEIFLRQFETPLHRYKFLVLSGPSRVGKTAFARTLCDEGKEVLEVNCASGDEPNLRAYRLRRHGMILFDEIVAAQVAAQRKLFQAQSAPVQLGCSATNCHSYEVFVWRTKLVLASNNWHASLSVLTPADQEWVQRNSIVLDVVEAMWVD